MFHRDSIITIQYRVRHCPIWAQCWKWEMPTPVEALCFDTLAIDRICFSGSYLFVEQEIYRSRRQAAGIDRDIVQFSRQEYRKCAISVTADLDFLSIVRPAKNRDSTINHPSVNIEIVISFSQIIVLLWASPDNMMPGWRLDGCIYKRKVKYSSTPIPKTSEKTKKRHISDALKTWY